jgi:hypothetical protein
MARAVYAGMNEQSQRSDTRLYLESARLFVWNYNRSQGAQFPYNMSPGNLELGGHDGLVPALDASGAAARQLRGAKTRDHNELESVHSGGTVHINTLFSFNGLLIAPRRWLRSRHDACDVRILPAARCGFLGLSAFLEATGRFLLLFFLTSALSCPLVLSGSRLLHGASNLPALLPARLPSPLAAAAATTGPAAARRLRARLVDRDLPAIEVCVVEFLNRC